MKKRYAGGLKLFAAMILAVSLLLVSFFGAVTVYGLTIGALPGGDATQTDYVHMLAQRGPGGQG